MILHYFIKIYNKINDQLFINSIIFNKYYYLIYSFMSLFYQPNHCFFTSVYFRGYKI